MSTPIGIKVIRAIANTNPFVQGSETTNTGILIRSKRGVPNVATRISSFEEALKLYGDLNVKKSGAQVYGMYAIKRLFENAKPFSLNIYVTKADEEDVAAETPQLLFNTTRIISRLGAVVGTQGIRVSLALNDTLYTLTIDNTHNAAESNTVVSTGDTSTYYNSLGPVIPGSVKVSTNLETFTDDGEGNLTGSLGGDGTVNYVNGAVVVGFNAPPATNTVIKFDYSVEVPSTVTEIYSADISELSNLWEEVNNSSALARVIYGASDNAELNEVTLLKSHLDGQVQVIDLVSSTEVDVTLIAGQKGKVDPGAWANSYAVEFTQVPNSPMSRNMVVYRIDKNEYIPVETVTGLTDENWVSVINDPATGSSYVKVQGDVTSMLPDVQLLSLSGGVDTSSATDRNMMDLSTAQVGLRSFDSVPVSLILVPESFTPSAAMALDNYVSNYKSSAMGVISAPNITGVHNLLNYKDTNGKAFKDVFKSRSKVAIYKGWETIDQIINGKVVGKIKVPACAAALGAGYVRKMMNETELPSIAPAGQNSVLVGTAAIDEDTYSEQDIMTLVRELGMNPIMLIPNIGYVVRTSRTMSTNPIEYDIHKLRCDNYLIDSFNGSLGWIEQEPNLPETRSKLVDAIRGFCFDLYNRGMFDKSKPFDEAVIIKCDEENNPESLRRQRILKCVVAVDYVDIIETAYIYITRGTNGVINITTNQ